MIEIGIPGFGNIELEHAVFDYNGTLAIDGKLMNNVASKLNELADRIDLHILTADTFGKAAQELEGISCNLHILKNAETSEDAEKLNYIQSLGAEATVAFGNGNNDRHMLSSSRLGIAIMNHEGCSFSALSAADIIVPDIISGLDLLLHPMRIKATLRY